MKFWKDIIAPGVQVLPDGSLLKVTESDVAHWRDTMARMKEKGIKIPVPWEHPDRSDPLGKPMSRNEMRSRNRELAKLNAGWVDDFRIGDDGSLEVCMDIPMEDDAKRLEQVGGYVSPAISKGFIDSRGDVWENAITHVALTSKPVIKDQRDRFTPADSNTLTLSTLDYDTITLSGPEMIELSFDEGKHKRAPKGGVTLKGTFYPGGKFIPKEVIEGLSKGEKKKLESGTEKQSYEYKWPEGKEKGGDPESADGGDSASGKAGEESGDTKKRGSKVDPPKKLKNGKMLWDGLEWDEGLLNKTIPVKPGEGSEIKEGLLDSEYEWLIRNAKTTHISAGINPEKEYLAGSDADTEGKVEVTEEEIRERYDKLERILQNQGYRYTKGTGYYGGEEETLIAFVPNSERKKMSEIGSALNQDSVLFTEGGVASLYYTTGEHKGKAITLDEFKTAREAKDFYTSVFMKSGESDESVEVKYQFPWPENDTPESMLLSRMGEDMPMDNEREDEVDATSASDVTSEDSNDDGINDDDQDGMPGPGEDGDESNAKVVAALAELGVVVPEGTKLSGDLNTLLAAIMTYKAVKKEGGSGDNNGDGEGMGDSLSDTGEDEENTTVLNLSQLANKNPRLAKILGDAREAKIQSYRSRIDDLIKTGRATPQMKEGWEEQLGSIQLSLDENEEDDKTELDIQLSTLEALPENAGPLPTGDSTSDNMTEFFDVKLMVDPEGAMSEEEAKEVADELLGYHPAIEK